MANSNQPRGGSLHYSNEWSNGLCNCCADIKTLLCVICCPPCFLCDLDQDAGECCLTSNICGTASLLYLRGKIRGHFKIKGDIWQDICTMALCPCCTCIQMKNELVSHGID